MFHTLRCVLGVQILDPKNVTDVVQLKTTKIVHLPAVRERRLSID